MLRLALAASALLSLPVAAREPPPPAGGRIQSDEGTVEIMGRPVRVGETLRLPEGFIRVEEKGTEDEDVGSFTVVPAESMGAVAVATGQAPGAGDPGPRGEDERSCRAERAAYLAELWRQSGIEVDSPDALVEGLEAGTGPGTGFYWFALATDAFRPLAWSSSLRDRANALSRCVRGL